MSKWSRHDERVRERTRANVRAKECEYKVGQKTKDMMNEECTFLWFYIPVKIYSYDTRHDRTKNVYNERRLL